MHSYFLEYLYFWTFFILLLDNDSLEVTGNNERKRQGTNATCNKGLLPQSNCGCCSYVECVLTSRLLGLQHRHLNESCMYESYFACTIYMNHKCDISYCKQCNSCSKVGIKLLLAKPSHLSVVVSNITNMSVHIR